MGQRQDKLEHHVSGNFVQAPVKGEKVVALEQNLVAVGVIIQGLKDGAARPSNVRFSPGEMRTVMDHDDHFASYFGDTLEVDVPVPAAEAGGEGTIITHRITASGNVENAYYIDQLTGGAPSMQGVSYRGGERMPDDTGSLEGVYTELEARQAVDNALGVAMAINDVYPKPEPSPVSA